MSTKAIIDLGTNTALMLVGHLGVAGSMQVLADYAAIVRLGQGVDAHRHIQQEAIDRVCQQLEIYKHQALELGAQSIRAFGTSALRDAANSAAVIAQVKDKTKIDLSVLSGDTEAQLTFKGATLGIDLPAEYAVVDIGGGSTELASGSKAGIRAWGSVDVGAVRITERFFNSLPPSTTAYEEATQTVRQLLAELPAPPSNSALVGVAGTATTLAAMAAGAYDGDALNGFYLSATDIADLAHRLAGLDLKTLKSIPQINPHRADIITAGALVLQTALELWQCRGVIVSTRGIRYGLLERELYCA